MQQAFRQLEERSVSSEIVLMEWSPKMDLIALANKNGEVSTVGHKCHVNQEELADFQLNYLNHWQIQMYLRIIL